MAKIKVEIPQKRTKIMAHIKEGSFQTLNDYKSYLSNLHQVEISFDLIFDALIDNIEKDKDFKKFLTSKPVLGAWVKEKKEKQKMTEPQVQV